MTNRTVLTYAPVDEGVTKKNTLKLYIKEGIVQNLDVDAKIVEGIQNGNLTAVAIRQTGKGRRSLVVEPVEVVS